MAAVIIRQKDVKRLGRELLKEMFDFLHDEYILTEFKDMKLTQNIFLNSLSLEHINTLSRSNKITNEEREELLKPFFNSKLLVDESGLFNKLHYDEDCVKKAVENSEIDTKGIYYTLNSLKLDDEINGDLYFKTEAFLDIFRVFESGYEYLED